MRRNADSALGDPMPDSANPNEKTDEDGRGDNREDAGKEKEG